MYAVSRCGRFLAQAHRLLGQWRVVRLISRAATCLFRQWAHTCLLTSLLTSTSFKVCNLVWSSSVNEVVSTHGYSQNQVVVWRYPSMSKVATLTGHSTRVLYLALSPDGQVRLLAESSDPMISLPASSAKQLDSLPPWLLEPLLLDPAPFADHSHRCRRRNVALLERLPQRKA